MKEVVITIISSRIVNDNNHSNNKKNLFNVAFLLTSHRIPMVGIEVV